MDIMNELPEERFNEVDDLLAFISIYDDEVRTQAYLDMLRKNQDLIRGAVCVEAGCGFGYMAEEMARLGAKTVYAVEVNPQLYRIARQRLKPYKNIRVVQSDIRDFSPAEPVNVLVQELFGQLLYDEDLYSLDSLQFKPLHYLPHKAYLSMNVFNSFNYVDETVSPHALHELKGALISGLFDDEKVTLEYPVLDWTPGKSKRQTIVDLSGFQGDLLCFGLQIEHDRKIICQAGQCSNWSMVWTPRAGDRFELKFKTSRRGTQVYFKWIE